MCSGTMSWAQMIHLMQPSFGIVVAPKILKLKAVKHLSTFLMMMIECENFNQVSQCAESCVFEILNAPVSLCTSSMVSGILTIYRAH